ncbi:hypothetical protein L2E82_17067 [Cichorium intybus]|uniref:Uncharacterized protein n=1 Tax=Cichorium intybus TaxID=13427 RepID=A0ACB9F7Q1_CICIN|nr:hypothetical protein L2E82_17067 [Cichorium intybus]
MNYLVQKLGINGEDGVVVRLERKVVTVDGSEGVDVQYLTKAQPCGNQSPNLVDPTPTQSLVSFGLLKHICSCLRKLLLVFHVEASTNHHQTPKRLCFRRHQRRSFP